MQRTGSRPPDFVTGGAVAAAAKGYAFHGRHHEISLNDPKRTAPDRLRTILLHPVRPGKD